MGENPIPAAHHHVSAANEFDFLALSAFPFFSILLILLNQLPNYYIRSALYRMVRDARDKYSPAEIEQVVDFMLESLRSFAAISAIFPTAIGSFTASVSLMSKVGNPILLFGTVLVFFGCMLFWMIKIALSNSLYYLSTTARLPLRTLPLSKGKEFYTYCGFLELLIIVCNLTVILASGLIIFLPPLNDLGPNWFCVRAP